MWTSVVAFFEDVFFLLSLGTTMFLKKEFNYCTLSLPCQKLSRLSLFFGNETQERRTFFQMLHVAKERENFSFSCCGVTKQQCVQL